ncbi:PAS domain S-box protein [Natronoflexus pectinivorans]|uniref:PAS domain S-box-containing protein n=1 Tax=Natronoflexus pectinivorans TaxID=682526 RepID=A0A4R2GP64_9BACT|nr:PAS domain S-box protein [Natronoflexus pectinivorans]TCO09586.1 PAS domain S-box-containing protein [Natronoflexus pectinivorans]
MTILRKLLHVLKGFNSFLMGCGSAGTEAKEPVARDVIPLELHPDFGSFMAANDYGVICLSEYFEIISVNTSALKTLQLIDGADLCGQDFWNLPLEFFNEGEELLSKELNPIWISHHEEENSTTVLKIVNSIKNYSSWFQVECKVHFINSRSNDDYQIVIVLKDISDEKKQHLKTAYKLKMEMLLSDLSNRFASVNLDEADYEITYALQELGKLTGVDQSYLFLYNKQGTSISCTHEWCKSGVDSQIENLQDLPTEDYQWWDSMLNNGEPVIINQTDEFPDAALREKQLVEDLNVESLLAVPVIHTGKVAGFFGFATVNNKRKWNDGDLRLLKIAAGSIAGMLKNIDVFRKLLTSERKFRGIIENSGVGVLVIDTNGLYRFANRQIYDQLEIDKNIEGFSVYDVLPSHTAEEIMKDIKFVLTGNEILCKDYVFNYGGITRWYQTTIQPLTNPEDGLEEIIMYTQDIYERKENEERIESLYRISKLILNGFDHERDLFANVLEVIHKLLPAKCSAVVELEKTGKYHPVAVFPVNCTGHEGARYDLGRNLDKSQIEGVKNLFVITDKYDVRAVLGINAFPEAKSLLLMRLESESDRDQYLMMVSETVDFFNEKRINMVKEMTHQLNIGLRQKHLNNQIVKYNQNLEVLVAERTREKQELNKLNETIIETTRAIVISSSNEGIVTSFNPMAETVLGYQAMDVVGRMSVLELFDPSHIRQAVELAVEMSGSVFESDFKALVYLSEKLPPENVEFAFYTKSGKSVPVLLSRKVINNDVNVKEGYLNVAMDISRLKKAELSSKLYWSAFEKFVYALVIADKDGKIVWANNSYLELSGYNHDEVVQRKVGELQGSGIQDEAFYKKMWNELSSGRTWKGEVFNKRKDETIYTEELAISPISDDNGNIINYLAIKIDVSDHKKLTEELSSANQQLSTLINNLPSVIVFEDVQRRIQLVNQTYCDTFGGEYDPHHFVGKDCQMLSEAFADSTIDPDGFLNRMDELIKNLEPVLNDRLQLTDGRVFIRNFFPVWINNELSGYLWRLQDITQQNQIEKHRMIQRLMGYKLAATIHQQEALKIMVNHLVQISSTEGVGIYLQKDDDDASLSVSKGFSDLVKKQFPVFHLWVSALHLEVINKPSYYLSKEFYNPEVLNNVNVKKIAITPLTFDNTGVKGYVVHISSSDEMWDYNSKLTMEGMVSQVAPVLNRIWKQNPA